MPLRRFQIADDGKLITKEDDLNAVSLASGDFDWLDFESEIPESTAEILADVGVEPGIIEECLHPHRYSRFLNVGESIYFEFPILSETDEWLHDYVSFIWMPKCLVTVRHREVPVLDDPIHLHSRLGSPCKASLLHQLLESMVKENIAIALMIREKIDDLSSRVDEADAEIDVSMILELKKRLYRYMSVFEDQMNCLSFLSQVDLPALEMDYVRKHFQDILKGMEHILKLMSRLERRLEYIQQHCMLLFQDKTNSRMKILTVISAIFLPLSLIAGIYGMNFIDMPELKNPVAYPVTLLLMVGIAFGMLAFFYRRGWFK